MINILKIKEQVIREKYKDLTEEEIDNKVKEELQKTYDVGIQYL